MKSRIAALVLPVAAAHLLFAQQNARQFWRTEFMAKRPTAGAKETPASKAPRSKQAVSKAPETPVAFRVVPGSGAVRPSASTWLGVTFWRLRPPMSDERGARLFTLVSKPGAATPTAPDTELVAERMESGAPVSKGDRIRVTVESPRPGFLYVVDREEYRDGTFSDPYLISPNRQTRPGDNVLAAGRLIEIPDQRDAVNYFTILPTRSTQVAEVLSLIVTPRALSGIEISQADTGTRLLPATLAGWTRQWKVASERMELEGGAGQLWTESEKRAATDRTAPLTRTDAPPQTLYRINAAPGRAYLLELRIAIRPE